MLTVPILASPWARVDPRPFPIAAGLGLAGLPLGFISWVWVGHGSFLAVAFPVLLVAVYLWVSDLTREGTMCGIQAEGVTACLTTSVVLFITSEVCFFFRFFWAWGHMAWAPSALIGASWPPIGVKPIRPLGVPLFNLVTLVWSSATLNLANGYLRLGNRKDALAMLGVTILLGILFEYAQYREYCSAPFSMCDGSFGSTFFLLTGFHGAHVLGGMLFLVLNFWRLWLDQFHRGWNVAWGAGVWYWHFVDMVWIFLWGLIYVWGGA